MKPPFVIVSTLGALLAGCLSTPAQYVPFDGSGISDSEGGTDGPRDGLGLSASGPDAPGLPDNAPSDSSTSDAAASRDVASDASDASAKDSTPAPSPATVLWYRKLPTVGQIAVGGTDVAVTGGFSGSADFGGTRLETSAETAGYVAKYARDGALLWLKKFGGTARAFGFSLTFVETGDVVVTGSAATGDDFGTLPLVCSRMPCAFVAKYAGATGDLLWLVEGGGDNVVAAPDGIVTSGSFGIAKYDRAGKLLWQNEKLFGYAIATDSVGDIVAGINFANSYILAPFTFVSKGVTDVAVYELTPAGDLLWAYAFGGPGADVLGRVAVDPKGDVYVTGNFQGNLSVGNLMLQNAGITDIFVVKLEKSGNGVIWAQSIASNVNDYYGNVAFSADGTPWISGHVAGPMQPVRPGSLPAAFFAAAISPSSGTIDRAVNLANTGLQLYGCGLAFDVEGHLFVAASGGFLKVAP